MTTQERFVRAYEDLARGQAVADERLTVLLVLAAVGVGLALLLTLLQTVALLRTRARYAEVATQLAGVRAHNDEVWTMLHLIRGWVESARIHSKEAKEAAKEAKVAAPVAERHVLEAVAEVPARTAEEVKRLMDDSDPFKKLGGP